jgi:hypothetical protein
MTLFSLHGVYFVPFAILRTLKQLAFHLARQLMSVIKNFRKTFYWLYSFIWMTIPFVVIFSVGMSIGIFACLDLFPLSLVNFCLHVGFAHSFGQVSPLEILLSQRIVMDESFGWK